MMERKPAGDEKPAKGGQNRRIKTDKSPAERVFHPARILPRSVRGTSPGGHRKHSPKALLRTEQQNLPPFGLMQ
jgi:hypothetical protein